MKSRTPVILGALVVLVSRILTAPRTPWENDEFLFAEGVRNFDPSRYHPHPPGYPLYILLGKIVTIITNDPWRALVLLAIIAAPIGFVALARAFEHWIDDADLAVVGALVFYFSASMLVHGTLAMSDGVSVAFLCLALWAMTIETERGALLLGIFASAAIGCRPQLVVPMIPMLTIAVWRMRTMRQRVTCVVAFGFVSLMWFLPLMDAAGGWDKLLAYETKQAEYFASHDAAMSRGAKSGAEIVVRFLLHPWGSKYVFLPLFLCVLLGIPLIARRWRALVPLFVFTAVQLVFELGWMDPADGARYSLPAMILFALAAGCGFDIIRTTVHSRAAPWIGAAVLAALAIWYTSPILGPRTRGASPVVAAATYANQHFAPNTIVLYDLAMRPQAEYLLPRFQSAAIEPGLAAFYDRPSVPLVLFADGGGRGTSFTWPDSDAYGKLTRNHYRVVTLEPIPPNERYLPGKGVYALERTVTGDAWRWLSRDATIQLPSARLARATLTLRLSPDSPYDINNVVVNGVRVAVTRQPVDVTVPAAREIVIHADQSFLPATVLHNQDPRILAVQLLRVRQE